MAKAKLSGKVYLVTGGTRRIGAQIVRQLHAAGASIIHYLDRADEARGLARTLESERQADLLDTMVLVRLLEATAHSRCSIQHKHRRSAA